MNTLTAAQLLDGIRCTEYGHAKKNDPIDRLVSHIFDVTPTSLCITDREDTAQGAFLFGCRHFLVSSPFSLPSEASQYEVADLTETSIRLCEKLYPNAFSVPLIYACGFAADHVAETVADHFPETLAFLQYGYLFRGTLTPYVHAAPEFAELYEIADRTEAEWILFQQCENLRAEPILTRYSAWRTIDSDRYRHIRTFPVLQEDFAGLSFSVNGKREELATVSRECVAAHCAIRDAFDLLCRPTEGRAELIEADGRWFVLDTAFSRKQLDRLIDCVKRFPFRRIFCVTGSVGNRDADRRPALAQALNRIDGCVLTTDNPSFEHPKYICEEIAEHLTVPNETELDRKTAIRIAFERSAPGDAILVIGKGREDFQLIGMNNYPHSDRKIILDIKEGPSRQR